MGRIGKMIISFFFMLVIVLFGSTTLIKAKGDIVESIKGNSIAEVPTAIDSAITSNFKSRNNWININGLAQRVAGVTIIRDAGDIDVYKMTNGQLTYHYPDCDMLQPANELTRVRDFANECGAEMLYVQLPCKAYDDKLMPAGTHTYGYEDADELIKLLSKNQVKVLDIRKEIEEKGLDISSLFFNTDHHWKPSTALWATECIADQLSTMIEGYDYSKDIYNSENYNYSKYEEWFLGSLGRRTGMYFGGVDDYETLIPTFETSFDLYTESQTNGSVKTRSGSFEEALMRTGYLDKKDLFSEMTFFTYMGTEYRLSRVTNQKAPNEKKVLMFRDSFSCPLLPFLALSAKEITAVDLRYYDSFDVKECVINGDYDAVIVVYNPSMFREERAFEFEM